MRQFSVTQRKSQVKAYTFMTGFGNEGVDKVDCD